MAGQKQSLGAWGEAVAAEYLSSLGYEVVARNVRTSYGEIDLIVRKPEQIIFVEVKARSSQEFGHPEEAVTASKQQHMLDAAQSYLQEHELEGDWRVDVISVLRHKGQPPEIVHFENALQG
jgi:putative endonuclease